MRARNCLLETFVAAALSRAVRWCLCLSACLCLCVCLLVRGVAAGLSRARQVSLRVLRPLACRVLCGCLRLPLFSASPRACLARGNFPLGLAQLLLVGRTGKQRFFRICLGNFGHNLLGGQITGPLWARIRLAFGSVSGRFRFGVGSFFGNFRQSLAGGQITGTVSARFRRAFGPLSARFRFGVGSLLVRFRFGFGSLLARFWLACMYRTVSCSLVVRFRLAFAGCRPLAVHLWLTLGPLLAHFRSIGVLFRFAFGSISARFRLGSGIFFAGNESAGHFSSKFSFLIQYFQLRAFDSLFARRS